MSDPAGDKVEEVDLDALEDAPAHDAKPKPQPVAPTVAGATAAAAAPASAAGSTTVEEVRADELAQTVPLPEIETTPWLLVCPLLVAAVLAWNVDWKEARVQRETAARRKSRTPLPRRPA